MITLSTANSIVDLGRIKQDKVKSFVTDYGLDKENGFDTMRPVCFNPSEKVTYYEHHKIFVIRRNIEYVWKVYKEINPKEAWNGEMVSFGLQYSRSKKAINYLDDPYSGMEKGQILILNLNIFWGSLKIAVAHEVAEVNEEQKLIKLCYMEGGASEGSQWISLTETEDGFTKVSHKTLYKSKSKFRDTVLYPGLHTKAITEFHSNVKKKAERANGL